MNSGPYNKLTIDTGHLMTAISHTRVDSMFNLESLEWLGDSVVNFAYIVDTIANNPGFNEELLTRFSHKKVSNQNLYHIGMQKELFKLILTDMFKLETCYLPPGYVPIDMVRLCILRMQYNPLLLYLILKLYCRMRCV